MRHPPTFRYKPPDLPTSQDVTQGKSRAKQRGLIHSLGRIFSSTALVIGIVACTVATALGVAAAGGALAGQSERDTRATQTTTADLAVQFSLGMADLQQGNYQLAAQRFRWILERDPNHPGAAKGLSQAEQMMDQASPLAATLPPSNAQNPDELFFEARQYYEQQQWENAIRRLQELQQLDPTYKEIEVREMLFNALQTLGLLYIRGDRIEEGLFLLDQAQEIRPLDDQAEGELYLASLYVEGRTYWGLSWPIAIQNFQAIYDIAPNYRDVADLLWEAHNKYAEQLVVQGASCAAAEQYEAALSLKDDSVLRDKLAAAKSMCAEGTPTPSVTPLGAPTAKSSLPTVTPLGAPTATPNGSSGP